MTSRIRSSRSFSLTVFAIALGAFATACSSTSTPSATTPAAPGTSIQQGTGEALVFSPTTLTVKQGTSITVDNVSSATSHTFTITGKGIDITNSGGQSQQVSIDLPPGTYPFFCRFHVSSGMKGTLVVT